MPFRLYSGWTKRFSIYQYFPEIGAGTSFSLITVLPEQLQSPLLTAEWEHWLKEIERNNAEPEEFMDGIAAMLQELISTYQVIQGAEFLFPSQMESLGCCPRCGGQVSEKQKGFFCQNKECKFVIWKNSRFFEAKKKQLTKSVVQALLKDGQVHLKGCYSEKTGKTYDAIITLEDDGERVGFHMEFDSKKGGKA